MKKAIAIIILGLLVCNTGFAEKLYIKCHEGIESFAVLDFDSKKAGFSRYAIPSELNFDIIESNDVIIKAKIQYWIDFPKYNGKVLQGETIYIDRVNGVLEIIGTIDKDTRVNVPDHQVIVGLNVFSDRWKNCEKIEPVSKF